MSSEPKKSENITPDIQNNSSPKIVPEKNKAQPQKNANLKVINFGLNLTKIKIPIPKSMINPPVKTEMPQKQIKTTPIKKEKQPKEDLSKVLTPDDFHPQNFEVIIQKITNPVFVRLNQAHLEMQTAENNRINERLENFEASAAKNLKSVQNPTSKKKLLGKEQLISQNFLQVNASAPSASSALNISNLIANKVENSQQIAATGPVFVAKAAQTVQKIPTQVIKMESNSNPSIPATSHLIKPSANSQLPLAQAQLLAQLDPENKLLSQIALAQSQKLALQKKSPPKLAAPLPELPSAHVILDLIEGIDRDIEVLQERISELDQERDISRINVPMCSDLKSEFGIQNYHGFLMEQKPVDTIRLQNAEKIARSHSKNRISTNNEVSHITQLSGFVEQLSDEDEMAQPMLNVVLHKQSLRREKKAKLAYEYKMRYKPFKSISDKISDYHKEAHECIDIWPPEFEISKLKTTDRSLLIPMCAPDQLMFLDDDEKECNLYYDENSFVADPVKEHEEFKKRLIWTESEKRIFIEKYTQHPRDFKKISAGLPMKTIKDVIEYYFNNRVKLNLKEIEKMVQTKGGRKKLITEGRPK